MADIFLLSTPKFRPHLNRTRSFTNLSTALDLISALTPNQEAQVLTRFDADFWNLFASATSRVSFTSRDPEHIQILSVGAGYSWDANALLSYFDGRELSKTPGRAKLWAVDIDPKPIISSRDINRHHGLNFQAFVGSALNLESIHELPKEFDVVAIRQPNVFDFGSPWDEILNRAIDRLSENGIAIVTTQSRTEMERALDWLNDSGRRLVLAMPAPEGIENTAVDSSVLVIKKGSRKPRQIAEDAAKSLGARAASWVRTHLPLRRPSNSAKNKADEFTLFTQEDLNKLYLALGLNPDNEHMPKADQVISIFREQELNFIKKIITDFYDEMPISYEEAEKFKKLVDSKLLPLTRESNGGFFEITYGFYRDRLLTIPIQSRLNPDLIPRIVRMGLPVFLEGELALSGPGSRSAPGWIWHDAPGYRWFRAPNGKMYLSLKAIDGATAEQIVKLCSFVDQRTSGRNVLHKPVGVHVFRDDLRVLFEFLDTRVKTDTKRSANELPVKAQETFDRVFSDEIVDQTTRRDLYDYGFQLEADYLFLQDGDLKMALPVRTAEFDKDVRNGKIFRFTNVQP